MTTISERTVGEAWVAILRRIVEEGQPNLPDETRELLTVGVTFKMADADESILTQYANTEHVSEMRKVFFGEEANMFGHSYKRLMHGPLGRSDLSDVTEMLAEAPQSKRVLVQWVADGSGKVPCVNALHFLVRGGALCPTYFARGQDVYNKFYADAICLFDLAAKVADSLQIPLQQMTGIISSAHVYEKDMDAAMSVLAQAGRDRIA